MKHTEDDSEIPERFITRLIEALRQKINIEQQYTPWLYSFGVYDRRFCLKPDI